MRQQGLRVGGIQSVDSNANAGTGTNHVVVNDERLGHGPQEPVSEYSQIGWVPNILHQYGEFVASETGDHVGFTNIFP